jgi:hypothetical protein
MLPAGEPPEVSLRNVDGKINPALTCDLLFALYRFHPEQAKAEFDRFLAPESPDAIKLCAIDAMITISIDVGFALRFITFLRNPEVG